MMINVSKIYLLYLYTQRKLITILVTTYVSPT